jgi:hypothetical protein
MRIVLQMYPVVLTLKPTIIMALTKANTKKISMVFQIVAVCIDVTCFNYQSNESISTMA